MKTTKPLLVLLAGMLLALVAVMGINASISFNQPVPVTWSVPSGTNAFGLDADARPFIMRAGTNYSGVSTNFALTNGATVTVQGGIVTGIQ